MQGVGFRPWVHRVATTLELRGSVFNTPRGVTIDVHGTRHQIDALVRALREEPPRASRVRALREPRRTRGRPKASPSRRARARASVSSRCPPISPPATRVSPRWPTRATGTSATRSPAAPSAARGSPSSRASRTTARTTMGPFELCPDCASASIATSSDRRFHAQAIACPACGPKVWSSSARRSRASTRAPILAVRSPSACSPGGIVGVQGLGGFHLACDATNVAAVARAAPAQAPRRQALRGHGARSRGGRVPRRARRRGRHGADLRRAADRARHRARVERGARGLRSLVANRHLPAVHAAPRAAAREGRPAAGDDLGQHERRADRRSTHGDARRALTGRGRPVPASARPTDRPPGRGLGGSPCGRGHRA